MVLHCGGRLASWEEVDEVPLPVKTDSYHPVDHCDYIRFVEERARKELGASVRLESEYALNKDGNQLFFKITAPDIRQEDSKHCLSIGGRNSYDMSMSAAFALGIHLFICDNLMFTGDFVQLIRKHTKNVWRDIEAAVLQQMSKAEDTLFSWNRHIRELTEWEIDQDEGYKLIGLAQGNRVLSPTQANIAFREWRKPSHEDFAPRNAWSLHNGMTEAGKKFSPAKIIGGLVGIDDLINNQRMVAELLANDQKNRVGGFMETVGLTEAGKAIADEAIFTDSEIADGNAVDGAFYEDATGKTIGNK